MNELFKAIFREIGKLDDLDFRITMGITPKEWLREIKRQGKEVVWRVQPCNTKKWA